MSFAVIYLNQKKEKPTNQHVTYVQKGHLPYEWVCITKTLSWKEKGEEELCNTGEGTKYTASVKVETVWYQDISYCAGWR